MIGPLPSSPQQILGAIVAGLAASILVDHTTEGNLTIKKGGPRRNTQWIPEWATPFVKLIEESLNWFFGLAIGIIYFFVSPQLGVNIGNTVGIVLLLAWAAGRDDADKELLPDTARSRALLAVSVFLTIHQVVLSNIGYWLIQAICVLFVVWVAQDHLKEKGKKIVANMTN